VSCPIFILLVNHKLGQLYICMCMFWVVGMWARHPTNGGWIVPVPVPESSTLSINKRRLIICLVSIYTCGHHLWNNHATYTCDCYQDSHSTLTCGYYLLNNYATYTCDCYQDNQWWKSSSLYIPIHKLFFIILTIRGIVIKLQLDVICVISVWTEPLCAPSSNGLQQHSSFSLYNPCVHHRR